MIIETVCKLLCALLVGFYLNKKGIWTKEVNRGISYLILNIASPCLVIASVNDTQGTDKASMLRFILVGCMIYLVMPFVSMLVVRLMRVKKEERGIYEVFFVFANTLYMGYPVAAAIYGEGCIFYINMFHILFNILYYTYGIQKITSGKRTDKKIDWNSFFSVGTIASLAALIFFLVDLHIPDGIQNIMGFIGNICIPVSMISIGASIGMYSLKSMFDNRRIYTVAVIRLVALPAMTFFIMTVLGFDGIMRGVATVTMGMPVGAMVSMGSMQYQSHEKIASSAVVVTTLCGIVLVPVMLSILNRV